MSKKITLFNTPIDALTLSETVEIIENSIVRQKQLHHVAVNVAKIVAMQKDKELYQSVISADIISADGLPLVWVSKLFGRGLPERVAGIDLMERLVKLAFQKNYRIFFLGAKQEVVESVVSKYRDIYNSKIIAGYRNGYFKPEEEVQVANEISESGANILFVAISSPKKELFLFKHKECLKSVNFVMGVGGSFDVVAGKIKRAPLWMQKSGLEWFFRIVQEPRRMWKRYLITNTVFIYYVVKELLKAKRPFITN